MNESDNSKRLARWHALGLFEQLSNIDGEIKHYIDAKKRFLSSETNEDHSEFYFNKVLELIARTECDPKNRHRIPELEAEKEQLYLLRQGQVSEDYITRYWSCYTTALSADISHQV